MNAINMDSMPTLDFEAGMRSISSDASVVDAITVRIAIWVQQML